MEELGAPRFSDDPFDIGPMRMGEEFVQQRRGSVFNRPIKGDDDMSTDI